ncbi:MAG: hypothetical protein JRF51_17245 [Deltaproteobacteria bacterium]|nr:hypothetical protein [Deltaproteobacteria bacterium]
MGKKACPGARIFVPLDHIIDVDLERKGLSLQLQKARAAVQKTESKLRDEGFLGHASGDIVEKERYGKAALLSNIRPR